MRWLILIVLIKLLLGFALVLGSGVNLDPDEAQYWTWSGALDWGYYSKPPGIAWEIWAGTQIFGDTELGVRFGAICLGCLLPIAFFLLSRSAGLSERGSAITAGCFAFSPLGILGGFFATTDGGMILFWTLACAAYLRNTENPRWSLIGLLVMFGGLFKWTTFVLWPVLFLWGPRRGIWKGMAISSLALLPSVYWNSTHDWATFKHVWGNISGGPRGSAPGNPTDFLLAQVALASPVFFGIFLAGSARTLWFWKQTPQAIRFCTVTSLLILGVTTAMAFDHKMQGNWAVYAYPTAFVVIGYYILLPGAILGTVVSLAIALTILIAPLPYHLMPFRNARGWSQMEEILIKAGYDPNNDFLCADSYQEVSQLSFYGPGQKRAYFLNLRERRKNQFSYWPGLQDERVGESGLFITTQENIRPEVPQERLEPYCEKVDFIGSWPLLPGKKNVLIYRCTSFKGNEPVDPEVY